MANITLTNQTNSPIKLDTTYFWVNTPTTADLTGLDLQIAEIYRDAGLGTVVEGVAPANTVAPTITGTARVGSTLTRTTGTWTGVPTPNLTTQWQRGTTAISGATGATYIPVTADLGQTIRVVITGTNASGTATGTSAATAAVVEALASPVNTAAPAITGTATVGQTLTSTTGTWTGNPTPTYTRQWQRGTTNIAGATADTYVLVAADVGQTIRVVVTGTNSQGNATATSANTAEVAGIAPANTVAPAVTGTPTVGETLTATNGTWTGIPTPTFTRVWQRSADGASGWSDISGATGDTYTLVEDDDGQYVRIQVTATNSAGSGTADSPASEMVVPE